MRVGLRAGGEAPAHRRPGPRPDSRDVPRSAEWSDQQMLVCCRDVGRSYPVGGTALSALADVCCRVHRGDQVAVTGPSGSGKSTLLHLLAGLDRPTTGTVSWPGLSGTDPPYRVPGLVGLVFQAPSLLPPLDVAENVALPLQLAGVPQAEAHDRADGALRALNLDGLGRQLPEELSGGQAQRVAVARVLAARPRLILADEPTGQLDHRTGDHVVGVLIDAAVELGASLVLSTHDPRVAARLPRRWQVHGGRLRTDESTQL